MIKPFGNFQPSVFKLQKMHWQRMSILNRWNVDGKFKRIHEVGAYMLLSSFSCMPRLFISLKVWISKYQSRSEKNLALDGTMFTFHDSFQSTYPTPLDASDNLSFLKRSLELTCKYARFYRKMRIWEKRTLTQSVLSACTLHSICNRFSLDVWFQCSCESRLLGQDDRWRYWWTSTFSVNALKNLPRASS